MILERPLMLENPPEWMSQNSFLHSAVKEWLSVTNVIAIVVAESDTSSY